MYLCRNFLLLLIVSFSHALWASNKAGVIEPVMVTIPAGEFIMGGEEPLVAGSQSPGQQPKHKVTIKTFELSQHEVTVKQFAEFIAASGYKTNDICWKQENNEWGMAMHAGSWNTPAYAPSSFHPVMCISWDDAQAYLKWLSAQTGEKYRLPSEAEWEYAARAGSSGPYYFGQQSVDLCSYANAMDQMGQGALARDFAIIRHGQSCSDGAEYTSVVGMYIANAFGLYDMLGNVAELVEDCQHFDYKGAPDDGSAWTTACDMPMGPMRIARGGSYNSDATGLHSAARRHAGQSNPSSLGEGFRIAKDIEEATDSPCHKTDTKACKNAASSNKFAKELSKAQKKEHLRRAKSAPRS